MKRAILLLILLALCFSFGVVAQDDVTEPELTTTGDFPWWNDRVFYQIFVRSFYDSDGDGRGDIQGIIEQLDYLNDGDPTTDTDLGVTGLWLMPIMQSPSYHGYDVVDFYEIEEDYGTLEDFRELMAAAHERGMVVIIDLVMNHTSTSHPWFTSSVREEGEFDDWYIWEDESPGYNGPWGQQVWHRRGGRVYYGVFWQGMPDLNYENPEVTEEMYEISEFWLKDIGVDGFRLDAIKHIIEDGRVQENAAENLIWMEEYYEFVNTVEPDVLTVGEVWSPTQEVVRYIGDKVDLAFEFDLAGAILQSVNLGNNFAVSSAQRLVQNVYPPSQYATFLTNHDQDRVMSVLDSDVQAAKVAATLLLTDTGVPFVYYGEEVGMVGQKPDERIRTPMQWTTTGGTGGFTTARPWEPLQSDHPMVNVANQTDDPESLLSHYRALVHLRNETPALRVGDLELIESDNNAVYGYTRTFDGQTVLVLVNLSDEEVSDYSISLDGDFTEGSVLYTSNIDDVDLAAPAGEYTPLETLPARASLIIELQ